MALINNFSAKKPRLAMGLSIIHHQNPQDGLLSLLVPSGQIVLSQNLAIGHVVVELYVASFRFAPFRYAPDRYDSLRFTPLQSGRL